MSKDWIKNTLIASGATRLAGGLQGPGVAILMYHSVMDDPRVEGRTLGGIGHSTEVFSRQMELIAREYIPVSLDDVMRALDGGQPLRPRSVVVTFDDGYADNHDVAMPILNRFGVPATFYITVDCVENAEAPWPSRLRYAFYTTKTISWHDINTKEWPLQDPQQRDQAYLYACDLCAKLAGEQQREFVEAVESALGTESPESFQRLMMTWDQVRALLKGGHIVGSHTMTHPNMAYVDDGAARRELSDSKLRLEEVLRSPVVHFSYPCPALWPHWNESTRKMSQEVGYRTAVTTVGGRVRTNDDPLALRRVRPSKEVDALRWNLECTFMGRAM
jgi:peptidoglycan/xylan/chitin deacetylase (PgdA/CDA1 family)